MSINHIHILERCDICSRFPVCTVPINVSISVILLPFDGVKVFNIQLQCCPSRTLKVFKLELLTGLLMNNINITMQTRHYDICLQENNRIAFFRLLVKSKKFSCGRTGLKSHSTMYTKHRWYLGSKNFNMHASTFAFGSIFVYI